MSNNHNINEIIGGHRLLEMLHEKVVESPYFEAPLYETIKAYTEAYLAAQSEGNTDPTKVYFRFIKSYNKDMKRFAEHAKYPLEIDASRAVPPRFEYDVILLFSCLFAAHRFRIMQLIQQKSTAAAKGLFIGCGPGLELELVKSRIGHLDAYDLSIDPFLIEKHPEVQFNEAYFTGENHPTKYQGIYLIELLEHLDQPYVLLEQCSKVLADNGKIYLTTATNIPQFDHLYNFESGHEDFENKVRQLGMQVEFMEDIPHQSITLNIGAKNRFYVLTRNS